nr:ParB/RepB/Spo0J family partition protein [Desulfobacterales bacterium]
MPKRQVLGRGLDSLIPDTDWEVEEKKPVFYCDVDAIRPNPLQPRRNFSEDELNRLAESIKEKGIIQPLVVRTSGSGYELIVGERRWRAARLAGVKEVPVILREVSDAELLETALIENLQREDLNPIEEAEAYSHLMEEFGLTQDQIARLVGKDRSTIANILRLRNLPQSIQNDIMDGKISMGHARAILGAEDTTQQIKVWRTVVSQRLSVRATETLVKNLKSEKRAISKAVLPSSEDMFFNNLERELTQHLGNRVRIHRRGKRGRLEIEFYGNDDLERLIALLKGVTS